MLLPPRLKEQFAKGGGLHPLLEMLYACPGYSNFHPFYEALKVGMAKYTVMNDKDQCVVDLPYLNPHNTNSSLLPGMDIFYRVIDALGYYIKHGDEQLLETNSARIGHYIKGANLFDICSGDGRKFIAFLNAHPDLKPAHVYPIDLMKGNVLKYAQGLRAYDPKRGNRLYTGEIPIIFGDINDPDIGMTGPKNKKYNILHKVRAQEAAKDSREQRSNVILELGATANDWTLDRLIQQMDFFRENLDPPGRTSSNTFFILSYDSTTKESPLRGAYGAYLQQWGLMSLAHALWDIGMPFAPEFADCRIDITQRKEDALVNYDRTEIELVVTARTGLERRYTPFIRKVAWEIAKDKFLEGGYTTLDRFVYRDEKTPDIEHAIVVLWYQGKREATRRVFSSGTTLVLSLGTVPVVGPPTTRLPTSGAASAQARPS